MKCKECSETEVIKINKPENVRFMCKKGHKWAEEYTDNGGRHKRPVTYEVKLEDVLFPSEKLLYKKVLGEIGKNQQFYLHSSAEDIAAHLVDNCNFNKEEIYKLFRKIAKYGNNNYY